MTVYQRFIKLFEDLEEAGIITSRADAAQKFGYKPQAFTEILKGRSKISVELMANFAAEYNISPQYLLFGTGQPYHSDLAVMNEPEATYGLAIDEKNKIIQEQQETIDALKRAINQLTK